MARADYEAFESPNSGNLSAWKPLVRKTIPGPIGKGELVWDFQF